MSGQRGMSEEVLHYQILEWRVRVTNEFIGESIPGLGNNIYKSLGAREKNSAFAESLLL